MGFRRKPQTSAEGNAGQTSVASPETRGATRQRETVRLSFCLSRSLHRRLKLEAVRRGETIVSMVSRWVAETTPAI